MGKIWENDVQECIMSKYIFHFILIISTGNAYLWVENFGACYELPKGFHVCFLRGNHREGGYTRTCKT